MRDASRESPHGLHLLRVPVLRLQSLHFGQIGCHRQHSGHLPGGIVEGGDREIDRHRGPILLLAGDLDALQGLAAHHAVPHGGIVLDVAGEQGERAADDLVGTPAVHGFGRGIPAPDNLCGVERVHGEGRALKGGAEPLVGVLQRPVGPALTRGDSAEYQASAGEDADVHEERGRGVGDRLHHERTAAPGGVSHCQRRHGERRERRSPRAEAEGCRNDDREQQVGIVSGLEERRREQASENERSGEDGAAHHQPELRRLTSHGARLRRRDPGEHDGGEDQRAKIIPGPPQAPRRPERVRGHHVRQHERRDSHTRAGERADRRCHAGERAYRVQVVERGILPRARAHEVRGQERLRRVAAGNTACGEDRDTRGRVGEKRPQQNGGPVAQTAQDQRREGDAGGWPDGRDGWTDRRVAQSELRDDEVDDRECGSAHRPAQCATPGFAGRCQWPDRIYRRRPEAPSPVRPESVNLGATRHPS